MKQDGQDIYICFFLFIIKQLDDHDISFVQLTSYYFRLFEMIARYCRWELCVFSEQLVIQ